MLSMFPKEIDRLPRPTVEALLRYIRKDDGDCDDPLFGLVMASFEHKTLNNYSNDWCPQLGRYLFGARLVTCRRIHISGNMYMGRNYETHSEGRSLPRSALAYLAAVG